MVVAKTLVLTGLSGAGKSEVAAHIARLAEVPHVDLDETIVRRAEMSIDLIFEKLGEANFRRLEAECLADALAGPISVVATGAGALVDDSSRRLALDKGLVVWLQVSPEVAAERVARSETRPLLAGRSEPPVERLRALLGARRAAYAESHHSVETDERTPAEVAGDVFDLWSAA